MLLQKGVRLSCVSPFSRWFTSRHSCSKLFVGGLSYDTNETVLKEAFEKYGEIIEVKVICDHVFGRSKGYGFVRFSSESEANEALKEMDGQPRHINPLACSMCSLLGAAAVYVPQFSCDKSGGCRPGNELNLTELRRTREFDMKMHFPCKLSERTN